MMKDEISVTKVVATRLAKGSRRGRGLVIGVRINPDPLGPPGKTQLDRFDRPFLSLEV
jgi:hypothetical protein